MRWTLLLCPYCGRHFSRLREKVDARMSRGVLSGAGRVQPQATVLWGRGSGFLAAGGQHTQYIQTWHRHVCIHAHTCQTYTYIHTQIHTTKEYMQIETNKWNTCTYIHWKMHSHTCLDTSLELWVACIKHVCACMCMYIRCIFVVFAYIRMYCMYVHVLMSQALFRSENTCT